MLPFISLSELHAMNVRALRLALCCAVFGGLPRMAVAEVSLAEQARDVLKKHCARCHAPEGTVKGGFDYVLQPDRLAARNKIVPGKAGESELFQLVRDGDMPPRKEKMRPSKEEIALVQQWIDAGAADWRPAAGPRSFVAEADLIRAMRADLEALPAQQRRFHRYFTLANLANAGRPDEELAVARLALAKLVNSLSWHARLTAPVAIPLAPVAGGNTPVAHAPGSPVLLRIDMRDYKWNTRQWDRLAAAYPYRTGNNSPDARVCIHLSGTDTPHLRADWFIATASRPPFYYDLLDMPSTDKGVERALQVEVAGNIDEQSVARAGFNGSGVSKNNRLIERHDAAYGAFWKTYDFSENTERQNLFRHPLGPPPASNAFVHAGGEMIFHLPNGLHGFLLADRNGRRIDRAPVEIVSDPQRPDKAVESGLSCMSCHAAGIIPKADQVRAHVLKNLPAFTKEDVETIKGLYPTDAKLRALVDEDNKRFLTALAKLGVKKEMPEPITAVTLRYEGVIDLLLAAADAGLTPDEFAKRLGASAELSRALGALRARGGSLQRETFVTAFPELVRELRLGDEPASAVPPAGGPVFGGHTAAILAIAFSSDGKLVLSGSDDRTVRLWDLATGRELRRFEAHRGGVATVAFSPDGKWAASAGHDRVLILWRVADGKELRRMTGHTDPVTALVFSPDGKLIASGGTDRTVRLWDAASGKEVRGFTGHEGKITSMAFAPDGKTLASASHDHTVRLWDIETGESLRVLHGHTGPVYAVAFAPDGRAVAAGGNDKMVRIWAVQTGQEVRRLEGHTNAVIRVAFAPDGKTILSGSSRYQTVDQTIRLWDVATGKMQRSYGGADRNRVSCAAFAPDGKTALTDGPEPVLLRWKLDE
ncbi:hypothetical protein AYO44_04870 [Planctomycetaceae bacterium SCGC AG-212-F19]|nr:hypothetical protein AYO44_04870 [Planctomycetaceae bacterium SCGC AG-212-F19]